MSLVPDSKRVKRTLHRTITKLFQPLENTCFGIFSRRASANFFIPLSEPTSGSATSSPARLSVQMAPSLSPPLEGGKIVWKRDLPR